MIKELGSFEKKSKNDCCMIKSNFSLHSSKFRYYFSKFFDILINKLLLSMSLPLNILLYLLITYIKKFSRSW